MPKQSFDFDLSSIGVLLSVVIVAFAAFSIFSLARNTMSFQRDIRSSGGIITAEEGLGISRQSIDWGMLEPNSSATENLTVTNQNRVSVVLNFTTSNWNPANASNWIHFSTNYSDVVLAPTDSVDLELYLTVDPDISGITDFSFDITVWSEEKT